MVFYTIQLIAIFSVTNLWSQDDVLIKIEELLKKIVQAGAPGVSIVVEQNGSNLYSASLGSANLGLGGEVPVSFKPDSLMRIASTSKTYIAAMIVYHHVKMSQDGTSLLDQPIRNFLSSEIISSISNADKATVRQLLNHTSGIADYRGSDWANRALIPFIGDPAESVYSSPPRDETLDLKLAYSRAACFKPGKANLACGTPYSNTNYVLLGKILDELSPDKSHHSKQMQSVLFNPLRLNRTFYEKHTKVDLTQRDDFVHGYVNINGGLKDLTWVDDGFGYANGGIVSTPKEVAHFYNTLFDSSLSYPMDTLAQKSQFLSEFKKTTPIIDGIPTEFGLGIMMEKKSGLGKVFYHGGTFGAYLTNAIHIPKHKMTVVIFINSADEKNKLSGFRNKVPSTIAATCIKAARPFIAH